MTATHGEGVYGNAAGVTTPLDHKMAQVTEFVKTAANTIRPGVLWDGNTTLVSGKANMSYDVRALSVVLTRGATAGAVKLTNDAVYNVVTTAAPGSNSRYDVVYIWQREYSLDGTNSDPVIGVVQGTAAASPTVPSLAAFPGALELARILVPSGVTATNSGTTITQTGPFTAAAGGVVPVRTTTERDAGTWLESQRIYLLDSDSEQYYNGSAWLDARGSIIPTSVAGTGTTLSGAVVTATTATSVSVNGCFTTGFSLYEITFDLTCSGAATLALVMRAAGTNATTAYDAQYNATVHATNFPAQVLNAASISLNAQAFAGKINGQIRLFNPATAVATTGTAFLGGAANPMTTTAALVQHLFIQHRTATAYDGFTLTPSTGTLTGTVTIRGVA